MNIEHLPVLLRDVIEKLTPQKGGIYVDATVGTGGHSEEILKFIGDKGVIIGIDRDGEALKIAEKRLKDKRVILKQGRFSDMERIVNSCEIDQVKGILFDLGVSMLQLKDYKRGFSFISDDILDMRMDKEQEVSARHIVNKYTQKDLERILREFGEESYAKRIAKAIVRCREGKSINTCKELSKIVDRAYGRRGKLHPATKTFQALRIEVNKELDELQKGLDSSVRLLNKGGRLCVISYQSLEDRIVKRFLREKDGEGLFKVLTKKPVVPGKEEISVNLSSRSAKFRAAERT